MSKARGKGKKQMKESDKVMELLSIIGDEYQLNAKEKLIVTLPAVSCLREQLGMSNNDYI